MSELETERIYLGDRGITAIEPGAFRGFRGSNKVVILALYGNSISSLGPGMFDGLESLKTVILNTNNIATIRNGTFDGLDNLRCLVLGENPLTCDDVVDQLPPGAKCTNAFDGC